MKTIITQEKKTPRVDKLDITPSSPVRQTHQKGQALVEFTLIFILLLIVAWIPADFGLAFYTGQIAQNAAREGARIAAADPNLPAAAATASCNMPACYSAGNIYNETAARLPGAMLTGASISMVLDPDSGANCNRMVTITVQGDYNYFFYGVLGFLGFNTPPSSTMTRSASMRWEHQRDCAGL